MIARRSPSLLELAIAASVAVVPILIAVLLAVAIPRAADDEASTIAAAPTRTRANGG